METRKKIGGLVSFTFSNSRIRSFNFGSGTDIYKGLVINKGCEIGNCSIDDSFSSYSRSKGVSVVDSKFDSYLDIDSLTDISRLQFARCTFSGQVEIGRSQLGNLIVNSECEFAKITVVTSVKCDQLTLENSTWLGKVEVNELAVQRNAYLGNCTFQKESEFDIRTHQLSDDLDIISEWQLERFAIDNIVAAKELSVHSNGSTLNVETLDVACSAGMKGAARFSGMKADSLMITGYNPADMNVIFNRCEFRQVNISRFNNAGHISFLSCGGDKSGQSVFSTDDANLGDTEFMDFRFNSFNSVIIAVSRWADIRYAFTTWFEDSQLEPGRFYHDVKQMVDWKPLPLDAEGNRFYNEGKREIYRQLKHASERQSDRVQALEFKARELKAFREQVRLRHDWRSSNYWILLFNWTNDHGLNWVRALCLTLGVSLFFFPLILIASSPEIRFAPHFTPDGFCRFAGLLWDNVAVYWQMLNPTRRTDVMLESVSNKEKLSGWVYFLETLHRIILAFLIFQTISAFRKYVK